MAFTTNPTRSSTSPATGRLSDSPTPSRARAKAVDKKTGEAGATALIRQPAEAAGQQNKDTISMIDFINTLEWTTIGDEIDEDNIAQADETKARKIIPQIASLVAEVGKQVGDEALLSFHHLEYFVWLCSCGKTKEVSNLQIFYYLIRNTGLTDLPQHNEYYKLVESALKGNVEAQTLYSSNGTIKNEENLAARKNLYLDILRTKKYCTADCLGIFHVTDVNRNTIDNIIDQAIVETYRTNCIGAILNEGFYKRVLKKIFTLAGENGLTIRQEDYSIALEALLYEPAKIPPRCSQADILQLFRKIHQDVPKLLIDKSSKAEKIASQPGIVNLLHLLFQDEVLVRKDKDGDQIPLENKPEIRIGQENDEIYCILTLPDTYTILRQRLQPAKKFNEYRIDAKTEIGLPCKDPAVRQFWVIYKTVMHILTGSDAFLLQFWTTFEKEIAARWGYHYCKDLYSQKIDPFLAGFNDLIKPNPPYVITEGNRFQPENYFINAYAQLVGNPEMVLSAYKRLYPKYDKVIIETTKQILRGLQKKETDQNIWYTIFFKIVLYANPNWLNILHAASKLNALDDETYGRLELHEISANLARICKEEVVFWGDIIGHISKFQGPHPQEYNTIIQSLGALLEKGFRANKWYKAVSENLKIQRKLIGFDPGFPGRIEAPKKVQVEAPVQIVPPIAPIPFPREELKTILAYAKEIDIQGKIKKAAKGGADSPTRTARAINYFRQEPVNTPVFKITETITFGESLKYLWNLARSPKAIITAGLKLSTFKNHYSSTTEPVTIYLDPLVIHMLQDEQFKDFLKDEEIVEQLSHLSEALGIKGFTADTAKKALELIPKVCELVSGIPLKDREGIKTMQQLAERLFHEKPLVAVDFLAQIKPIMESLVDVMRLFTAPRVEDIEILAFEPVAKLLKDTPTVKKLSIKRVNDADTEWKEFGDCSDQFLRYDEGELGRILAAQSPIPQHIHLKKINNCRFNKKGEITHKLSDKKATIGTDGEVPFEGRAFEGFSFVKSEFSDFEFKDMYLTECDFSEVEFQGTIRFTNLYIDSATAGTFIPTLSTCLARGTCTKLGGKIILIELADKKKNNSLIIPIDLKEYIDSNGVHWVKDYAPIFENVETIERKEEPKPSSPQLPSQSYSSMLWGGLSYMASDLRSRTPQLSRLSEYVTGSKVAADEVDSETKSSIKELEKAIVTQTVAQEELKKLIAEQQGQIEHRKDVADQAATRISELEKQFRETGDLLEFFKKNLERKRAAQLDRIELKKNDLIKEFYQTLSQELCSSFLSIYLLQSKSHLLASQKGQALKISNTQQKGIALQAIEENPGHLEKARKFFSKISDHGVGILDKVGSVIRHIPLVGSLAKLGIDKATEYKEHTKLESASGFTAGLKISDLEEIADEAARIITHAYEEPIKLLDTKGSAKCGGSAGFRIVAGLLNGRFDTIEKIENFPIFCLRCLYLLEGDKNIIKIPTEIAVGKRKNISITDDHLFRKCGVKYFSNDKWHYYSADKEKAELLGYMAISPEEYENFYRHYTTRDESPLNERRIARERTAPDIGVQPPAARGGALRAQPTAPRPSPISFELVRQLEAKQVLTDRNIVELTRDKEKLKETNEKLEKRVKNLEELVKKILPSTTQQ